MKKTKRRSSRLRFASERHRMKTSPDVDVELDGINQSTCMFDGESSTKLLWLIIFLLHKEVIHREGRLTMIEESPLLDRLILFSDNYNSHSDWISLNWVMFVEAIALNRLEDRWYFFQIPIEKIGHWIAFLSHRNKDGLFLTGKKKTIIAALFPWHSW